VNGKQRILISGNEAFAEAAVRAGCSFYAGYPITPQNELTEYMSHRMMEKGGVFIQAESELASINMVFGASLSGVRAMTSSSSPGISLMQEGISYLAGCELPAVIVNVMRGGPGLGNIAPSQADYFQSTRGGGHGDYRTIVLAPSTVAEIVKLTPLAFELADKYRNVVLLLGDGILGQMMEAVDEELFNIKTKEYPKPWALRGCKRREPQLIKSLYLASDALEELNSRLEMKYKQIETEEVKYEELIDKDTQLVLVAYGTVARICRGVVRKLKGENINVGLFRPVTLWPFAYQRLDEISKTVKKFLVVEMNAGQMIDDVRIALDKNVEVEFLGRTGGSIPSEDEIIKKIRGMLGTK